MHKAGFYEKYVKRALDIVLSSVALIVLSPLLLIIAIQVKKKLGSPIAFVQKRPGKDGRIFDMYKFRTMTDERDENGNLLPDEERLTRFGQKLRSTSADELLELVNILKGDLSICGPRPQLVRDMVFMTPEQNRRHEVRQGLTGLAQVEGRNCISWEKKLELDVKYVDNISFLMDLKIILKTIKVVLTKEGADSVSEESMDFGDCLLREHKITKENYEKKQELAKKLLGVENE